MTERHKFHGRALAVALLCPLLCASACSRGVLLEAMRQQAEDHYENKHQTNSRDCELLPSEPARERCRQELPPASYEEYERQRRTVP